MGAAGTCDAASVGPVASDYTAGRWHEGSQSAATAENFNNAAATIGTEAMAALHSTCNVVGTTASCAGHEFDSICAMASCEDTGNTAALTSYCRSQGGPANTVTAMCRAQLEDGAAITDLCAGFVS